MIHFISTNFVDYVLITIFDIIVALIFFLFFPKLLRWWIRFLDKIDQDEKKNNILNNFKSFEL